MSNAFIKSSFSAATSPEFLFLSAFARRRSNCWSGDSVSGTDAGSAGVNFHESGESTYALAFSEGQLVLGRRERNGPVQEFSGDTARSLVFEKGAWYLIRVEVRGQEMIVFVDNNRIMSTNDEINLYLIDLASKEITCLTEGLNLTSINNPDYSQANGKIIFSAQKTTLFHNYLFTLDLEGNLNQITNDDGFHDFDCSWSEDGTMIAYSRLIDQAFPW